jgi:hypothetical protein
VPADVAAEVYRTVGQRGHDGPDATWAPWWRAQAKAIHHVLVAGVERGRWTEATPGAFDALLAKELLFADYLEGKITAAEHEAARALVGRPAANNMAGWDRTTSTFEQDLLAAIEKAKQ